MSGPERSLGALLLACAACAPAAEAPPLPDGLDQLEDSVARLVRETWAEAAATPGEAAGWAALAQVYEANNLLALAAECYDRALELAPEEHLRYRRAMTRASLGDVDGAIDDLRALVAGAGRPEPHVLWRLGRLELLRGDLDDAEADFRRATEVGPRYPGGFTGLARVLLQRDQNEAAVDALRKARVVAPHDAYVSQLLGAAYRQAGREDEPEAKLISAGRGEPPWADPWADELNAFKAVTPKMRAKVLSRAGRTAESVEVMDALRREGGDEVGALSIMAESYFRVGRLDDALAAFRECLTVSPRNVGTFLNIARVQEEMGALDDAVATLDEAITLRPDFGHLHDYRGKLLLVAGRNAEAVASLERALELDARRDDTRLWLGRAHLALGENAEARAIFEAVAEQDPPPGDAWTGLAELALAEDRLGDARAALREARARHPEDRFWLNSVRDRLAAREEERP